MRQQREQERREQAAAIAASASRIRKVAIATRAVRPTRRLLRARWVKHHQREHQRQIHRHLQRGQPQLSMGCAMAAAVAAAFGSTTQREPEDRARGPVPPVPVAWWSWRPGAGQWEVGRRDRRCQPRRRAYCAQAARRPVRVLAQPREQAAQRVFRHRGANRRSACRFRAARGRRCSCPAASPARCVRSRSRPRTGRRVWPAGRGASVRWRGPGPALARLRSTMRLYSGESGTSMHQSLACIGFVGQAGESSGA